MRALGVLPQLAQRHELLILAGGDAYRVLTSQYPVVNIPTLKYHYNRRGKLSNYLNLKRNLPAVLDFRWQGPTQDMVAGLLAKFEPAVVMSDSEPFTLWAARRLHLPTISFDHFGLLVYCRPEMSRWDRFLTWRDGVAYRMLYGKPDRIIVSGFFSAPPRRQGVQVVGPVIRQEVRQTSPTRGDHLLVYLNKGDQQLTPRIQSALNSLGCPVRVYGTTRQGGESNLEFKPLANLPFIEDLASCRAVFGTTGNQLLGEVIHFGKPMLGMPQACVEQRLNAVQLERMGIGMQTTPRGVTAELLREFLSREEQFVRNAQREARDGAAEALEAIDRFAAELAPPGGSAVQPNSSLRRSAGV